MRCRRRRYTRRPPNPARTASLAGRAPSRSYFPVASVVVLVFFLFELVVEFFVVVLLVVVLFVVLVVFVLRREVELDRRQTRDLQVRAALGTTDLVAFVDVELVDFDFGVALGAGSHRSSTRASLFGLAIGWMTCQNPTGRRDCDKNRII